MAEPPPLLPQPGDRTAPALAEAADRRRPGRPRDVDPHLVPLLRFRPSAAQIDAAPGFPPPPETPAPGAVTDDADSLAAARGIVFAVLISAVFWTMVGALVAWG